MRFTKLFHWTGLPTVFKEFPQIFTRMCFHPYDGCRVTIKIKITMIFQNWDEARVAQVIYRILLYYNNFIDYILWREKCFCLYAIFINIVYIIQRCKKQKVKCNILLFILFLDGQGTLSLTVEAPHAVMIRDCRASTVASKVKHCISKSFIVSQWVRGLGFQNAWEPENYMCNCW